MNGFIAWLVSPLSEWSLQSLQRKLLIGAVGAGVAWYLHSKKDLPTWQVVLFALAAAYGASMLLAAASRFSALPAGQPLIQLPAVNPTPVPAVMQQELTPVVDEKKDEGLGDDQGIFG